MSAYLLINSSSDTVAITIGSNGTGFTIYELNAAFQTRFQSPRPQSPLLSTSLIGWPLGIVTITENQKWSDIEGMGYHSVAPSLGASDTTIQERLQRLLNGMVPQFRSTSPGYLFRYGSTAWQWLTSSDYPCFKVGRYYHSESGWCTIASTLNCLPENKQPDMQKLLNSIASHLRLTTVQLEAKLDEVDSVGNPIGGLNKDDVRDGLLPAIAELTGVQMRTASIPINSEAAKSALFSLKTDLSSGSPLMMTYMPESNNFLQGGHAVEIQSAGNDNVNLVDPADQAPHQELKSVDDVLKMHTRDPRRNVFFVVPASLPTPRYLGP
jgi:hypothetical protein